MIATSTYVAVVANGAEDERDHHRDDQCHGQTALAPAFDDTRNLIPRPVMTIGVTMSPINAHMIPTWHRRWPLLERDDPFFNGRSRLLPDTPYDYRGKDVQRCVHRGFAMIRSTVRGERDEKTGPERSISFLSGFSSTVAT